MSRLRPKLTYANVMVTLLAFVVLGTGAAVAHHAPNNTGTGALRQGAVTAQKLRNRAVRVQKLAVPLRPRWAVVHHDGSLVRSRGANDAGKVGMAVSLYAVTFDRDVSNCAYAATLTQITGGDDLGFIHARPSGSDPNDVIVETRDHNGITAARSFHLHVSC